MESIRIFHIIDSLRSGGKERQLVELLKGLSSYKEIVCEIILMSNDVHFDYINNLNLKIHYLTRKRKKDLNILFSLFSLCRKFKPSIIHTWDSMTSVYALPLSKIFRVKFINGMIRDAPAKIKPFSKIWLRSKFTFKFSDVIVSNSKAGLISFNAPQSKSIYIYNGFDFLRIKKLNTKESVKKEFKIETDKIIGMVGSFSGRKDYKTYISAAHLVLDERDDVSFLTIGAGKDINIYNDMVKTKYRNRILFLDKQINVESIINIFDIGVLATYTEGISNSIMEYMALAKPVIASKCGGTKELVVDDKTGILVKPEDELDLYRALCLLLDNKDLRKKMGAAGKARIQLFFNLDRMTQSYLKLYQDQIAH